MKLSKLILMACIAMGLCIAYTGCGGGGGGDSTETPPADLPSDSGGGGGDDTTGDTVDPNKELIANALARIAINAALKVGLGIGTDDELINERAVQQFVDLSSCGNNPAVPPGFPPDTCQIDKGETTENCPVDCSCGDGRCDATESVAVCPQDCTPGCPQDCTPVCGDHVCAFEEVLITPCAQDCAQKYGNVMSMGAWPMLHGMPVNSCRAGESEAIYRSYDDPTDAATVHSVSGGGVCNYGYRNDDVAMQEVTSLFIDIEFGVTDVPINGLTFTCTETMYNRDCMEGSAQLVFMPDGTIEFYTALSGKVYAYREDPPEAYTIAGVTSRGRITLPPAHQTCIGSWCPDYYRFGDVSVSYDIDGDGVNDYAAYYLNVDDSIDGPDEEICQSFMVDRTMIRPDEVFGPSNPPVSFDEDGNGLASCDDPACADHPFCQMSYCDDEGMVSGYNYHGFGEHPACPVCGDGTCDDLVENHAICPSDCP